MRRIGENDAGYVWKQVPYIPMSMARKEVRAFAEAMERKLRANEEKGERKDCDVEFLIMGLEDQMAEFQRAVDSRRRAEVLEEAAEVANYLMMICDRLGAFDEKSEGEFIILHPEGEGDVT